MLFRYPLNGTSTGTEKIFQHFHLYHWGISAQHVKKLEPPELVVPLCPPQKVQHPDPKSSAGSDQIGLGRIGSDVLPLDQSHGIRSQVRI
jgi:hypothetical protein